MRNPTALTHRRHRARQWLARRCADLAARLAGRQLASPIVYRRLDTFHLLTHACHRAELTRDQARQVADSIYRLLDEPPGSPALSPLRPYRPLGVLACVGAAVLNAVRAKIGGAA